MAVDTPNPDYTQNIKKIELIRDCTEGATAIKSRAKGGNKTMDGMAGSAYLPVPDKLNSSLENKARYESYVERASFVNFTAHTVEGMVGMVFRRPTTVKLPTNIEYLIDNSNGNGLSLTQAVKRALSEVSSVGRYGLLVDYPTAEKGLTEAQVRALDLKCNILPYTAESILNWCTTMVNGVKLLSMVVLMEDVEVISDDGFEITQEKQYRVLKLEDGVYKQCIYNDDGELLIQGVNEEGEAITDLVPTDATGQTWDIIPFQFLGSVNNDEAFDKAPVYDIAELNVSHYRNSADFEESSFIVGQPTPFVSGLSQSWVNDNYKNGVRLGSLGGGVLPEGGSASLLQANENQMPSKGMEIKEKQMIMIGARIIEDTKGNESATGAKIRFSGQNSKLGTIIDNVENAYLNCLVWCQRFMGDSGEPELLINRELYDATLDPQTIMANIQLLDRAVIAKNDLRYLMRRANMLEVDRTDEQIEAESEEAVDV